MGGRWWPTQSGRKCQNSIVESGIRNNNPMFNDEGITPLDFSGNTHLNDNPDYCRSEAGSADFCNNKIVVARWVDPILFGLDVYEQENMSPIDFGGHDTHVAGIAAGRALTVNFSNADVDISGVAPASHLMIYKALYISPFADDYAIEALGLSQTVGLQLEASIAANSETRVDIASLVEANIEGQYADIIIPFSSTGPNNNLNYLKSDLAAPHVAGAAALLKQQHPQWSAAQIKSALVNTAESHVLLGSEINAGADFIVSENQMLSFTVPASDVDHETLSFSASATSSGVMPSFTIEGMQITINGLSVSQDTSIQLQLMVSDGIDQSTPVTVTISVEHEDRGGSITWLLALLLSCCSRPLTRSRH